MVAFQKKLDKSMIVNLVKERVFKMTKSFARRGKTKQNIRTYQKLDRQIGIGERSCLKSKEE